MDRKLKCSVWQDNKKYVNFESLMPNDQLCLKMVDGSGKLVGAVVVINLECF